MNIHCKFQIYIYILSVYFSINNRIIEWIFHRRRKISRDADSKRQITRVTAMSRPGDISTGNLRCCYCTDTSPFSPSPSWTVGRRNMERSGNKSRIYNGITRLSRWRPFPPLLDPSNCRRSYGFSEDKEGMKLITMHAPSCLFDSCVYISLSCLISKDGFRKRVFL